MDPKELADKLEVLDVESFASLLRFDYEQNGAAPRWRRFHGVAPPPLTASTGD
jgi:hypothetical protein